MITTKVFKVKSDVKTTCHCGHEIKVDDKYFIIRTTVPKWVSLCVNCVHLLAQPIQVDMQDLKKMWGWEDPKKPSSFILKLKKDREEERRIAKEKIARERNQVELKNAEWV